VMNLNIENSPGIAGHGTGLSKHCERVAKTLKC
jgi:hypothetical protein